MPPQHCHLSVVFLFVLLAITHGKSTPRTDNTNDTTTLVRSIDASPDTIRDVLYSHVTGPLADEPLIIRGGVTHWVHHWNASKANGWENRMHDRLFLSEPFETALYGPRDFALNDPRVAYNEWLPFSDAVLGMSAAEPDSFVFGGLKNLRSKMLPAMLWESILHGAGGENGVAGKLGELEVTSLGRARHGLPFHTHGAAILGLVQGSKHWLVAAPEDMHEELFRRSFVANERAWHGNLSGERVQRCLQRPGDLMYVE